MKRMAHGSYPFDSSPCRWKKVQDIGADEAAALLHLTEEQVGNANLWINHGYILLNPAEDQPELDAMSAFLLEMVSSGEVGVSLPVGTQAIYLSDGTYSLIERIEVEHNHIEERGSKPREPHETHPYGRCECTRGCKCSCQPGPAAYLVERCGQQLKVCTCCHIAGDQVVKILVDPRNDPFPFIQYDPLGALALKEYLQAQERRKEMN